MENGLKLTRRVTIKEDIHSKFTFHRDALQFLLHLSTLRSTQRLRCRTTTLKTQLSNSIFQYKKNKFKMSNQKNKNNKSNNFKNQLKLRTSRIFLPPPMYHHQRRPHLLRHKINQQSKSLLQRLKLRKKTNKQAQKRRSNHRRKRL